MTTGAGLAPDILRRRGCRAHCRLWAARCEEMPDYCAAAYEQRGRETSRNPGTL
jgi:hypothetical protein